MGRERGPVWVLLGLAPLLGLGVLLAAIVLNGAGIDREDRPPVEDLTIDRVSLPTPDEIVVSVTNGGPEPVTVSQVTVNEALWDFRVEPDATISPLGSAEITLPYSWIEGEAYGITLITGTGTTFSAEVPAAVITPTFSARDVLALRADRDLRRRDTGGPRAALVPVPETPRLRGDRGRTGPHAGAAGLAGRGHAAGGSGGSRTVARGLLRRPAGAGGGACSPCSGCWGPSGCSGGRGETSRLSTSYRIALGIGLHNLGEGLAIGAAFALGEAALGTFLVVGFTLHNITEGVGIAAPILEERPRLAHFAGLALLGGGPAVLGTWIGGFAYSNLASAVLLAVGAGAILQVIYEVTRLLLKDSARSKTPALSAPNLGGFTAGVAIMYATALLVSV